MQPEGDVNDTPRDVVIEHTHEHDTKSSSETIRKSPSEATSGNSNSVSREVTTSGASKGNSKYSVIEPKQKLSFDDRMMIIQSTNDGFEQPNYSVKKLSNGNYRITKKFNVEAPLNTPQTFQTWGEPSSTRLVSQKGTLSQGLIAASNDKTVKLSNEMLMFEHVLDLTRKYDKLHDKYKRMKHGGMKDGGKPSTEVSREPQTEVVREPSTEVVREPSTEVVREPSKDVADEVVREPQTEVSELPPREVVREVSRVPTNSGWRAALMRK